MAPIKIVLRHVLTVDCSGKDLHGGTEIMKVSSLRLVPFLLVFKAAYKGSTHPETFWGYSEFDSISLLPAAADFICCGL